MTKPVKWLIVPALALGLLLPAASPARAGVIESVADCGSSGDIRQVRLSGSTGAGPYVVAAGRRFTVTTVFTPSRGSHETRLTVTAETSYGEVPLVTAEAGPMRAGARMTVSYTVRLYPAPRGETINLRTEVGGLAGAAEVCTGVELLVV